MDKKYPVDVLDVRGKVCLIRVKDPVSYMEETNDMMGRELKKAGAAMVVVCKPEDKIEALSDKELRQLGLRRISRKLWVAGE